jgi:hypothetical protein
MDLVRKVVQMLGPTSEDGDCDSDVPTQTADGMGQVAEPDAPELDEGFWDMLDSMLDQEQGLSGCHQAFADWLVTVLKKWHGSLSPS